MLVPIIGTYPVTACLPKSESPNMSTHRRAGRTYVDAEDSWNINAGAITQNHVQFMADDYFWQLYASLVEVGVRHVSHSEVCRCSRPVTLYYLGRVIKTTGTSREAPSFLYSLPPTVVLV